MKRGLILALCLCLVLSIAGCKAKQVNEPPDDPGDDMPAISVSVPQFATPDGVYNMEFAAVIVNMEEGEKAYYTRDGSEPSQDSILYTDAGIPLTEGENLVKIVKFGTNGNYSDVLTANLTIVPHEPDYSNHFAQMVKQGDMIYYVQHVPGPYSEYTSFPEYSKLCSYNLSDGSTRVVLDQDIGKFIIRDEVVYYEHATISYDIEDEGVYFLLCSIGLDGENPREILKYAEGDISYTVIMVDNWIYYRYRDTRNGEVYPHLYRINVNTLAIEQVSENNVGYIAPLLVDRDIYYSGWEGGWKERNIYRYSIDTGQNTLISEEHPDQLKVFAGCIYYKTTDFCIYKTRSDDTGCEKIPGDKFHTFVVAGDRIYYGYSGIYRIRFDGSDENRVCPKIPANLEYYRGKLYFYENDTPHRYLYAMDIYSNEVKKLFEEKGHLYFIEGETYFISPVLRNGMAGLYKLTESGLQKLAGAPE